MLKALAKTFSILLHPLFMPIYGLLVLFQSGSVVTFMSWQLKAYILMIVAINTLILPMLILPIMVRHKMAKDYSFSNRKERFLPLLFTFLLYAITLFFIGKLAIPVILKLFIIGSTLAVLCTLIINLFWKISIHMVGIGGLTGILLFVILQLLSSLVGFLLIGLLFSGVIGTSRLYLGVHDIKQIAAGYALGLVVMLGTLYLF